MADMMGPAQGCLIRVPCGMPALCPRLLVCLQDVRDMEEMPGQLRIPV